MRKLVVVLGMLGGGAIVGAVIGRTLVETVGRLELDLPVWGLIPILLGLILLAILIHELGHTVGGRLGGFRFIMLTVGPFKVVRENERIHFRWNTSLNMFGGLALMLPSDETDLKRRMLRYIAGGPLASVLVGTAALLASLAVFSPDGAIGTNRLFMLAFAAGSLNLAIGLIALVPAKSAGFATDGAQLLDLLRGGNRTRRRLMTLTLVATSMNGTRPRALDDALIDRLISADPHASDTLQVVAHHYAYLRALDRNAADEAGAHLDAMLAMRDAYPTALQASLFTEAAYYRATHRHDAAAAREMFDRSAKGFTETHTRARAEAAVLLAEDRHAEALDAANRGLAALKSAMDPGCAAAERDWLQSLAAAAGASPVRNDVD